MSYLGRQAGWLKATFVFRGVGPFVRPSSGVILWARPCQLGVRGSVRSTRVIIVLLPGHLLFPENLPLWLVVLDLNVVIPVVLGQNVLGDLLSLVLALLFVLIVPASSAQYSRVGTTGSSNTGVLEGRHRIAFDATED